MENLIPRSNIENKVRNTRLPRTKPLLPLFEVVSNSIHSIEEAIRKENIKKGDGSITIDCIRNGAHDTLASLKEIDQYPIHSFIVEDNGIGLNDENLNSYIEADTDHKIEIGGKGVGRFVSLKAFKELNIYSQFKNGSASVSTVSFDFKATKQGFHNFDNPEAKSSNTGTKVRLHLMREEYQKHLNFNLVSVAREIVAHFQLYFIRGQAPNIIVRNQNNVEINLQKLFKTEFQNEVDGSPFNVSGEQFTLYLTKSFNNQSHRVHFCAHNRSVKNEGLYSRIIDLGKKQIEDEEGNKFYYQAYVVGDILDENVDTERLGFNFPDGEDDEDQESIDINLAKLRKAAINCIEELLHEYLEQVRTAKVESYKPVINDDLPQYRSTMHYRKEQVSKLPPDLSKEKLDIELYKIDADWRREVKEKKIKLLEEKKDVQNLEEYKQKYEKFLGEFNDIGKSDLAKYVVHRKAILDLLETLIEQTEEGKFEDEDLIHSVFFPIRSTSDEIQHDKQNLWLVDERLTYHSFLASDKAFKSIPQVSSDEGERSDLLIYNDAFAFSDSKNAPHNSFTIVEFKKPMRDNYQDYDDKKNPIEQTENYIDNLLDGKVKGRNGRMVEVDEKTPFYVYIICDITPSLQKILKRREFKKTPDGKGYFKSKSEYYSAYFEVLPFEKVLSDAHKRNRILFERLNIE